MLLKTLTASILLAGALISEATAVTHGRAWSSTNEGKFSISVQGGILPVFYLNRQNPNNVPNIVGLKPPLFSKQFNLPSDLVGELGYMVKKDFEVFYNLDWSTAGGKKISTTSNGVAITQKFSQYNAYGNYLGTRYYFEFKSVPVKPFVGVKIGLLSQNSINVKQTAAGTTSNFTYFKKLNSFAGGLQAGVDWQLLKFLSLTLKAEAIFAFSRKGNTSITQAPLPVLKIGSTGTQLLVPVTLGVKFTL